MGMGTLTEVWKLDVERLHATVFRTDDEAYELGKSICPKAASTASTKKTIFWEMGETVQRTLQRNHYAEPTDLSRALLVNAEYRSHRNWHLVFIQYNRKVTARSKSFPPSMSIQVWGLSASARYSGGKALIRTEFFMPYHCGNRKTFRQEILTCARFCRPEPLCGNERQNRTLAFAIAAELFPVTKAEQVLVEY
jgi:hypothetical protein